MYRLTLRIDQNTIKRIKDVQKEYSSIFSKHFSLNDIVNALLTTGLDELENTK